MDYYLVIDFEATCSDDGAVPRNEMEIIEIGAVMVCATTQQPVEEYQAFVRPVRNSMLTPFCCDLTGIRQSHVESARQFPEVLREFVAWGRNFPSFIFCSWGAYDRSQLKQDCEHHQLDYPFGDEHINLKAEFSHANGGRKKGILAALRSVGLSFTGAHHRGIDDARNVCRLIPFIFPPMPSDDGG